MKTVKLVWLGNGRKVTTDHYMVVKFEENGFYISKCIQVTAEKADEFEGKEGEDIEVPDRAF